MSKKRNRNGSKKKNNNLKLSNDNNTRKPTNRKNKKRKKRRSKIEKIFALIFSTIYSILVSLRLAGNNSNKFATLGVFISITILIFFSTRRNAYEILVDNVPISVISMSNETTEEDFTKLAVATLEAQVNTTVLVNEEVSFRAVNSFGRSINTLEHAIRTVSEEFTYKVEAGRILVDGVEVAIVSSVMEAESIYRELIQPFINDSVNIVDSGFLEDVQIIPYFVYDEDIVSRDIALSRLTTTTSEIQVYEVVVGDTLSTIASSAGMTLPELVEHNPGLTITTPIRVGDQINLSVIIPFLNVYTEEELILTETLPYNIEHIPNDSEHVSFSRVVQTGIEGQSNETYHIRRVNGEEVERRSVEVEIVAHPTDRIVEVGTAT